MTAPSPTVLLDLAERCERATGPDWQLSRDIFKAIGGLPDVWFGSKVISWFGNGPWGCNTEDGFCIARMHQLTPARWMPP